MKWWTCYRLRTEIPHPNCRVLLSKDTSAGDHLEKNLSNVLTALIHYFRLPEKQGLSHDAYQQQLCSLRERQNLFNKQVYVHF